MSRPRRAQPTDDLALARQRAETRDDLAALTAQIDQVRDEFRAAGHYVSPRDDVNDVAAAWFLGSTPKTLANKRCAKIGPPCWKLDCGIRYPIRGLLDYLVDKRVA